MELKRCINILLIAIAMMVASCSTVYDDLDGCPEGCNIRFKYDYNMKWADAFANEVDQVTLYVFDSNNKFVKSYTGQGAALQSGDYTMSLDLQPGTYNLVAVAGATGESFAVSALSGSSSINDLNVNMVDATGDKELHPMWHGIYRNFKVTGTYQSDVVSLIKDTNKLRVVLQQVNNGAMSADQFSMSVNDDNTSFAFDNSVIAKGSDIVYTPYMSGSQSVDNGDGTSGNIVYSQFGLSRLMSSSKSRLTIKNSATDDKIIDIPLINYLLLTEMEGHDITAQEYLDRQDEYSLVFFLDDNLRWLNVQIIVNGWTIRLNNGDLN